MNWISLVEGGFGIILLVLGALNIFFYPLTKEGDGMARHHEWNHNLDWLIDVVVGGVMILAAIHIFSTLTVFWVVVLYILHKQSLYINMGRRMDDPTALDM